MVTLTQALSKLFDFDCAPLIKKIKLDLPRCNLIPYLDLNLRTQTIKMYILPRLLYFFQAVCIELPTKETLGMA